jgi:hypothetical protein
MRLVERVAVIRVRAATVTARAILTAKEKEKVTHGCCEDIFSIALVVRPHLHAQRLYEVRLTLFIPEVECDFCCSADLFKNPFFRPFLLEEGDVFKNTPCHCDPVSDT